MHDKQLYSRIPRNNYENEKIHYYFITVKFVISSEANEVNNTKKNLKRSKNVLEQAD